MEHLGWIVKSTENDSPCAPGALAKSKQMNISKIIKTKAHKPGERLFLNISSMKTRSLDGSKFWVLIVDFYSDYICGADSSVRSQNSVRMLSQSYKNYIPKENGTIY